MSASVLDRLKRQGKRVQDCIKELESDEKKNDGIQCRALRLLDLQRRLRNRIVQYHPMSGIPAAEGIRHLKREKEKMWVPSATFLRQRASQVAQKRNKLHRAVERAHNHPSDNAHQS